MTARERRAGGGCVFERASGVSYPVRTGPAERRVASYREWLDSLMTLAYSHKPWRDGIDGGQYRDLIAALRRPKVTE